jgi:hypothetical protein
MNNLVYLFLVLIIFSCRVNSPDPTPNAAVLAKHQARFGTSKTDVQLQKILYNGRLFNEYFCTNGYATECKSYLNIAKPTHYATQSFSRIDGKIKSFGIIMASFSGEAQTVGELRPRNFLEFKTPLKDSVREVVEEYFYYPRVLSRKFLFNKGGFITQESLVAPTRTSESYTIVYTRNIDNNISGSLRTTADGSLAYTYKYDNHQNPFFKIGVDRSGEISVHSLSGNNITEISSKDQEGRVHIETYTYEYLTNGYPSKVTVSQTTNGSPSEPYILEFIY